MLQFINCSDTNKLYIMVRTKSSYRGCKKMKTICKWIVIVLVFFFTLVACAQKSVNTNPPEQIDKNSDNKTEDELDESDLSPTPGTTNPTIEKEVILYFSDNDLMDTYRVKANITVEDNNPLNIAKSALEAWIKGPSHDELHGLIHPDVMIEYVENKDGVAYVSFSEEITKSNLGSTGELMFAEQIVMIMEQFGFEQTQILVEGQIVESIIGHLFTAEPLVAGDPDNYQWIKDKDPRTIVVQNIAFRIFEPAPHTEVKDKIVIRGLARVFEGVIMYEFEDGHFILDEGFTTATKGAPEWGEFEITIDVNGVAYETGLVVLYEESAKDGSRINELIIPLKIIK